MSHGKVAIHELWFEFSFAHFIAVSIPTKGPSCPSIQSLTVIKLFLLKNTDVFKNFSDHKSLDNVMDVVFDCYYQDWKQEYIIDRGPVMTLNNLKLVKKIRLKTILLNNIYLSNKLKFIKKYKSKIVKVLISSVVPLAYKNIKKFIEKSIKINCIELKKLKLNNLLKIKVNKKQIGSDRLANAIAVIDKKRNDPVNSIVVKFLK